jgi:glycosyltransferase involved in cell wall biosynthesis
MSVYFDISDVIKYAVGNSSISGIQRVQVKLIFELARLPDTQGVRVCYLDPLDDRFYEVDPKAIFPGGEFDSAGLLGRLGMLRNRFLPEKFQVKRYLKKYEQRKVRRGLEKLIVYVMAFVARSRLRERGMLDTSKRPHVAPISKLPLTALTPADTYALLGSFWDYDEVMAQAAAHKVRGGRVVALIHDLIPLVAPKYSTAGLAKVFSAFVRRLPDVVTEYLTVSNHTAQDLRRALADMGVTSPIRTLRLAHELSGFTRCVAPCETPPDIKEDYVLCVGTIEVRKNGILLLRAWQQLLKDETLCVPKLVFCGKLGWRVAEFTNLLNADPRLRARVDIISSPSDAALAAIYRGARFCLFPSFYEGWGLPVGEAAWFGRVTLASSAASVPEVCGDLLPYAAPEDMDTWVAAIRRLLIHPEEVTQREAAIAQAKLRTWHDVAVELYSIVMSL